MFPVWKESEFVRFNLAFFTLLALATLALGLELREFPLARNGDLLARSIVLTAAPVLVIAVALLLRIVSRVDQLRRSGKVRP